jgi:hypothetical protein
LREQSAVNQAAGKRRGRSRECVTHEGGTALREQSAVKPETWAVWRRRHLTPESADEPDGRGNPVLESFKFLIVIPLKDDHICRL